MDIKQQGVTMALDFLPPIFLLYQNPRLLSTCFFQKGGEDAVKKETHYLRGAGAEPKK
ncbi:MAG: hypothetical protein GTN76_03715, partial [Candidatus Aenigmarchaeota archaeon]|nr:hypothetical protein [Candidatus Aenigmarchaeota archaeon]